GRRTPRSRPDSALGVLRRLAGLLQAVLAALLRPRVTGEEADLLQRRPVLAVDLGERAGDAQPQRAGLAAHTAAVQPGDDVERALGAERDQRLVDDLLVHLVREVDLERPPVDPPLAGAGHEPNAGHGLLAAAGRDRGAGDHRTRGRGRPRGRGAGRRLAGVDTALGSLGGLVLGGRRHVVAYCHCSTWVISKGTGCWARCGCSGPAYTLSFFSMRRPSRFFGSMPRTAFSTARSGCLSSNSSYGMLRNPPG